ncbi:hypothetical protein QYM36_011106, partial [Artemia franciscana]
IMQQVSSYAPSAVSRAFATISCLCYFEFRNFTEKSNVTNCHSSISDSTLPAQIHEQISHKYLPIVNPSIVGSPMQVVQNNVKMPNIR